MASNFADSKQLYDTILILDFGSQYTHLVTRRIRELGVYCEVWPGTSSLSSLEFKPKGIILSGGPSSVYDQGAPHVDKYIFQMNIPILGICYGHQEIAWQLEGHVEHAEKHGYGHAMLTLEKSDDPFLAELPSSMDVWMSHGDQITLLPPHFKILGSAPSAPCAIMSNAEKRIYGVQFHPEVTHTPLGRVLLRNFALTICHCQANWTMSSFIECEIQRIRRMVGEHAHVIGAVSGGVDSTVAAVLVHRAIGSRFHAILVDHGFMRLNEVQQVKTRLIERLGIDLHTVDASDRFFTQLAMIDEPEEKRKRIGHLFVEVFEAEAIRISQSIAATHPSGTASPSIEFLLQGTLYPDVIESLSAKSGGHSATIKTHHNVGGLSDKLTLKLIEPLRELFKDEVRALGALLSIDQELLCRHPFPGPGLAIRILGPVSREQVKILQHADAIYLEEIRQAGLYRIISQAFAVLLPVRSVGVMGDQRTYDQVVALRAVETTDYMTATWYPIPYDVLRKVSTRIINEVDGVNRVTFDISSKPPSTIEWE